MFETGISKMNYSQEEIFTHLPKFPCVCGQFFGRFNILQEDLKKGAEDFFRVSGIAQGGRRNEFPVRKHLLQNIGPFEIIRDGFF